MVDILGIVGFKGGWMTPHRAGGQVGVVEGEGGGGRICGENRSHIYDT